MNKQKKLAILIFILALSGCQQNTSSSLDGSYLSEQLAAETIQSFFQVLYEEDYQRASDLYGGSYAVLENYNPDLDPGNRPQLWKRACQVNGFVCLPVKKVIEVKTISRGKYEVSVSFQTPDGELFVRSDCCGSTEAKNQLETVFTFQIEENQEGQAQVMDLPVYQP